MDKESKIDTKNDNTRAWFSGNVLLLGLVSFFADVSGEMMTPVLPLFIAALLIESDSDLIIGFVIGFIGGLGDAVANIVKVFSGYLADKTGRRKRLITVGYGIPFFAKLGIGLSNAWEQVLILKPTERLGKGIRGAPRDSLLADSIPFELRGKAFGFHRMMDTAGAIIGSFLALGIALLFFNVLVSELEVLKLIIIISAFISLAAVIPIFFLSESAVSTPEEKRRRASLVQNLKELPRSYYKFLVVSIIFGLGNFTILLFILHSKTVVLGIDETASPLVLIIIPIIIFIWFNIIYTALSIPFGSWSDKYGRKPVFGIGLALFAITCFGFLLTTDIILLFIFFGIYGAFNAATDGIQKAFVVDLLPQDLKGTGIGLLQTLMGFAGILGGIVAGFLYDLNLNLAFIYGGMMTIIALILLIIIIPSPKIKIIAN
ncbi:MAG: MFS transporter [Candidatus Heimdallarchaeota archaeon]|nr:MAG: MFS transporter [Candidatus Heimdallarchaeota archaeon]